ncbi:hypothetical protein [Streptomyces sp. NPDC059389]|uniref:hypothetical protein n=1 Tax=Streptomyces sp. NPDC059389 TaxID=3346818 RepID=UPI00368BEEA4
MSDDYEDFDLEAENALDALLAQHQDSLLAAIGPAMHIEAGLRNLRPLRGGDQGPVTEPGERQLNQAVWKIIKFLVEEQEALDRTSRILYDLRAGSASAGAPGRFHWAQVGDNLRLYAQSLEALAYRLEARAELRRDEVFDELGRHFSLLSSARAQFAIQVARKPRGQRKWRKLVRSTDDHMRVLVILNQEIERIFDSSDDLHEVML